MIRRLSSQILIFQALILALTTAVGFALSVMAAQDRLDDEALRKGEGIAKTVAIDPEIVAAIGRHDRSGLIQRRAEAIRKVTGVDGVIIADEHGIRYSHPVPERVFTPLSVDPSKPLAGQDELVVTTGSLGRGARARIPIRDASGEVIGISAVTVLQTQWQDELGTIIPITALYTGIALAIGLAASLLLARRLKRQTFGLELNEIASLLREREAMLRGVREGVVATDATGRIQVVNDEARRLLDLPKGVKGRMPDEVVGGQPADLLSGRLSGEDFVLVHGDRVLLASRMPVQRDGRDLGAVVTLRDRTELDALARELDSVRGLTDAMRAQAHEFSNRLHTIAGLLRYGEYDEVELFIREITEADADRRRFLGERVDDSRTAALLLAKSTVATERGVELRLADDLRVEGQVNDPVAVVTVLGNLIDNALDATRDSDVPWVEVGLTSDEHGTLRMRVADSGRGVPADERERIFEAGYSTKPVTGEVGSRGVGLALVRRTLERRGGSIVLTDAAGGGAQFDVLLPDAVRVGVRR